MNDTAIGTRGPAIRRHRPAVARQTGVVSGRRKRVKSIGRHTDRLYCAACGQKLRACECWGRGL